MPNFGNSILFLMKTVKFTACDSRGRSGSLKNESCLFFNIYAYDKAYKSFFRSKGHQPMISHDVLLSCVELGMQKPVITPRHNLSHTALCHAVNAKYLPFPFSAVVSAVQELAVLNTSHGRIDGS